MALSELEKLEKRQAELRKELSLHAETHGDEEMLDKFKQQDIGQQMQQMPQQGGQPWWMRGVQDAGNAAYNTIAGAGDALANIPIAASATLTGTPYHPTRTGEGPWYEAGNIMGNVAPFIATGGESIAPEAAAYMEKNIPSFVKSSPKIAEGIGSAVNSAKNIAVGSTYGGLMNPENPMEGMKEGLMYSAFGETLPALAKGAGQIFKSAADKLTRNEYSKDILNKLANHYESAKAAASKVIKPVLNKAGQEHVPDDLAVNLIDRVSENSKIIGKKARTQLESFANSPTVENLHKLQSELGAQARYIKPIKGITEHDALEELTAMRESALDALGITLKDLDPKLLEKYNLFRKIYKVEVSPYLNDKTLNNIAHRKTTGITPETLLTKLEKASEGIEPIAHGAHPVAEAGKALGSKLQKTEAYRDTLIPALMSMLGGAGGGLMHGPGSAALGFLAGPTAAKMLTGGIGKLTNPKIAELMNMIGKAYPTGKQAELSQLLAPQAQGNE